jgi:threonine/homoserine/homoserine lactone efflux protein
VIGFGAAMTDPLLFLLAVLTLLGTPGPTNTLLATGGAMVGIRRALPLLVGEICGYLIAIAAIRILLAPMFAALPVLAVALKIAVALYLCWVALALWRKATTITASDRVVTLGRVFVTTLLNPKALIFALSIIPLGGVEVWPYALAFCLCVVICGSLWILFGHLAGTLAGASRRGLFARISAVALAAFAGLIFYSALR